ncbi:MAG: glycosyltransferase family 87 protein [Myxococcales bacterium]
MLFASALYSLWPLRELVRGANDFAFVYAAGRAWAHGFSPYDIPRWHAEWAFVVPSWAHGQPPPGPFVYPPHWALLAAPLGVLPWPLACRIWDLVNVVSYGLTCLLAVRMVQRLAPRTPEVLIWAFVALTGLNGAVRWCLYECQLSLLPLLGVCAAFWAREEKRSGLLVLSVFVASLKPQICLLPLLFLLLDGSHKPVLQAGAAALLVSVIGLIPSGLSVFPEQFRHAYDLHLGMDFMKPSEFYNVSPLLAGFAPHRLPLLMGPLLGMVAVVALVLAKRWLATHAEVPAHADGARSLLLNPLWQLCLLAALEIAFTPQHGYDLVMYTPVVVLAATFRQRWLSALAVLVIAVESRALQIEQRLQIGPIAPYLSLGIVALCVCAVCRVRAQNEPASTLVAPTKR